MQAIFLKTLRIFYKGRKQIEKNVITLIEIFFVVPTILNASSVVSNRFLLASLLQKRERVSIAENLKYLHKNNRKETKIKKLMRFR